MKNVAGYDLSKLVAGSFGSLAAIVSATFKLSPLPAASRTLVAAARDAEELGRFVREVMASQLEPIAFEIHVPSFALMLRFASVPAAVDAQAHAAEMMLGAAKLFEGDAERAFWSQHNERVWTGAGAIVRASWLPANVAAAIGELKSCAATSGVIGIEMLGRAAVGSGLVRIEGEAKAQARAIEQLRRSAAFGNVVLRRGSTELKSLVDVWDGSAERQPLFASLKRAFDPQGDPQPGRGPYERVRDFRRRPSADRDADRHVRALRLLPAVVSDLRALGRGDGFAARTHLPDEGGPRRAHGDGGRRSCSTSMPASAAWRA